MGVVIFSSAGLDRLLCVFYGRPTRQFDPPYSLLCTLLADGPLHHILFDRTQYSDPAHLKSYQTFLAR